MRIIGLDVGMKTIGVAVSDPLRLTAQGVKTVRRKGLEADINAIESLVREYEADEIMIGLPLNMNGSSGSSVKMAKSFGQELEKKLPIRITYRDERYSTMAANRILLEGDISRKKRKAVIDKIAAAYVLQGYLDFLRNKSNT